MYMSVIVADAPVSNQNGEYRSKGRFFQEKKKILSRESCTQ